MDNGFWSGFLANFLSDLLVGGLLAGIFAFWISRSERSQQRKDEKIAELSKTIRYLGFLKEEVDNLFLLITDSVDKYKEITAGVYARTIPTPFWDSLQPGGELPRLLDPGLLSSLAEFYSYVANAKRGTDLVLDSWSASPSLDRTAFVQLILSGFEQALRLKDLPDKLDAEIQALEAQLEKT